MTATIKLYSIEEIEEWASKRADDAGRLSRQLLDTMRENERLHKAALLAARWFKLNYDCQDDVPPSKADLAGMFDAMQDARLAPSKT